MMSLLLKQALIHEFFQRKFNYTLSDNIKVLLILDESIVNP
jgi:hypothetical protein